MLVVVAEPEAELRSVLIFVLLREGYEVVALGQGVQIEPLMSERQAAALILDLSLPDVDGAALCQRLRSASGLPIIALGGRRQVDDLVRALEAGADDYLAKPFHHRELLARLRALLRRTVLSRPVPAPPSLGALALDEERCEVVLGRHRSRLSRTEFHLLSYFVRHAGRAVPAAELLQHVWGRVGDGNPEVVGVAIHRLCRKLARLDAAGPTVRVLPGGRFAFEGRPGSTVVNHLSTIIDGAADSAAEADRREGPRTLATTRDRTARPGAPSA